MTYDTLSADMSGEDVVIVSVDGETFRIVRQTIDGEDRKVLAQLDKREAMFLSQQLDDAVIAYERGETDEK